MAAAWTGAEPLLSRLSTWMTFVVYPSAVIAYGLTAKDDKAPKKQSNSPSSSSK